VLLRVEHAPPDLQIGPVDGRATALTVRHILGSTGVPRKDGHSRGAIHAARPLANIRRLDEVAAGASHFMLDSSWDASSPQHLPNQVGGRGGAAGCSSTRNGPPASRQPIRAIQVPGWTVWQPAKNNKTIAVNKRSSCIALSAWSVDQGSRDVRNH
jgi:hypothetical protein